MEDAVYRELLHVGRQLVAELEPEAVLRKVLEVARRITGARYAALGVLDESRQGLDRFLVSGLDEKTQQRIGELPRGRGVLGELIRHPQPLRLASVGHHPRSYGFPPGHPPMETFLGAPVMIRGEVFGNVYLTEKEAGEFSEDDEEALVILAEFAGVAIENAGLHERLSRRNDELKRAVLALETSSAITRALAGETELERVLELISKRGRAVVEAQTLAIMLIEGDELNVVAAAGVLAPLIEHARVPLDGSVVGEAVRSRRVQRLAGENQERFRTAGFARIAGVSAVSGLFVPLIFRGNCIGTLVALDRLTDGDFSDDDASILEAFADSAAMAVGSAQDVWAEHRRRSLQATEAERRRWARELHDDTLQELAAVKLGLAASLQSETADGMRSAIRWAMEAVENRVASLRGLIADVRPASLDELGLQPALESLAERVRDRGLTVRLDVDLDYESGRSRTRPVPVVEDAVYRLSQEALTNALKHAEAESAQVTVAESDGMIELRVHDDGRGFSPDDATMGFGVLGMRERVELLGGRLEVRSEPGAGTELHAVIPGVHRTAPNGVSADEETIATHDRTRDGIALHGARGHRSA